MSDQLRDLLERATRAEAQLLVLANDAAVEDMATGRRRDRYSHLMSKREGVALVKSYIDEAIRCQEGSR